MPRHAPPPDAAPRPLPWPPRAGDDPDDREAPWAGYNLVILACCLIALGLLAAAEMGPRSPEVRSLLEWADTAVCAVFLVDFVVSLVRAENKLRYLATWGWIDLLSAIPAFDAARLGRAARVLRVLRVLRGIKAARILLSLVVRYRTRNAVLAGSLAVIVALFAGSVAILEIERDPRSTIRTADDAMWWALCTITTVGYGDLVPVTRAGRAVAALLMLTGVSMFGAFAGILAGWFTGSDDGRDDIRRLTEEVASLRARIEDRDAGEAPRRLAA